MNLNLNENLIKNIDWMSDHTAMQYLQVMNANKNQIRELGDFCQPRLRKLELNDNKIASIEAFRGVASNIKILSLANNRIADLTALANMPHCEELYLAGNKITSFGALEQMPSLKTFHVRGNRIAAIDEIF